MSGVILFVGILPHDLTVCAAPCGISTALHLQAHRCVFSVGGVFMANNAIDALKADHRKVEGLLKELTDTTTRATKTRAELLKKIAHELDVHTRLEEEIFYPAFKKAGGKAHDRMFFEGLEEHRAVERLVLPDLRKTDVASEKFSGRAKVLRELVEHHADEEEKEMFPKARKALSADELKDLGEQMEKRRKELTAK
jgi:hemerythrin superfamily protein